MNKKSESTFETCATKKQIAICWLETLSYVTSFKITGACPGNLHYTHVGPHLPFSKKVLRAHSPFLHVMSLAMLWVLKFYVKSTGLDELFVIFIYLEFHS